MIDHNTSKKRRVSVNINVDLPRREEEVRRRVPLRLCYCLELIVMLCKLLCKLHSPIALSCLPVDNFERGNIAIIDCRLLSLQGDACIQAADQAQMQIRYCVFVDDVIFGCLSRSVGHWMRVCNQRVVRLAISNSQQVKHVVEFYEGVEPKEDENLVEERHTPVSRGCEKRWRQQTVQLGN